MTKSPWEALKTYQSLDSSMFKSAEIKQFAHPQRLLSNTTLAESIHIDLDWFNSSSSDEFFCGKNLDAHIQPIAQAYAGHQFGHFTILGDGRAILLSEYKNKNGHIYDIHLKGAGPTIYSRRGDGLATLRSMLKEYVYSEAMHGLGIPTSRSLALFLTGESVQRERVHPGAFLVRMASSHIRIGTFQFARLQSNEVLKQLADYTIQRHYPDLLDTDNPYLGLLEKVIDQQASLIAQWMSVGFIHGVMNTDNSSIAGETIDFGPCAFLDEYDANAVFSSIDHNGRYAYGNQATIIQWNLCRLAESLLPLIDSESEDLAVEKATTLLKNFSAIFDNYRNELFCKKIGIDVVDETSIQLVNDLLSLMQSEKLDFTHTFQQLSMGLVPHPVLLAWQSNWEKHLNYLNHNKEEALVVMRSNNPVVIARNHVLEEIYDEIEASGDLSKLHDAIDTLRQPYNQSHLGHPLSLPRPTGTRPTVTYCGT